MSEILIDSYSETNAFGVRPMYLGGYEMVGQSFTGNGCSLSRSAFYGYKLGNPTGLLYAKIYAHSGTFGTSSVATGAPIAISDPIDISTIGASSQLIYFTFSGSNQIQLVNSTKYVTVLDAFSVSGSGGNYMMISEDSTSSTHAGNMSEYAGGSWSTLYTSGDDLIFYVYGTDTPSVTTSSPASTGSTRATFSGTIISIGTSSVDEEGFVYSLDTKPLPGNVAPASSGYESVANSTGTFTAGAYTKDVTGLSSLTTYYVRAYAHNSSGYGYGPEITMTTANLTTAAFYNTDPTIMFRDMTDSYNGRGGSVSYDVGTTDLTGLSLDYVFNTATIAEGYDKCLSMAPSDWYYYVDPGTNLAYFKQISTTATHRMTKGRHLSEIDLVLSTENLKNKLYFTGGGTGGGDNFYKQYQDDDSITAYGQQIDRKTDNRVTTETGTADAIGDSFIEANKNEAYETRIEVLASTYDTTLFRPGDTIGFFGFGNFIEGLIFQIVRIEYEAEKVMLSVGTLPKRTTVTLEQVKRDVIALQTVANPSSPS